MSARHLEIGKEMKHEQKENIQFMVSSSGSTDFRDLLHHPDGDITVFQLNCMGSEIIYILRP